MRDTGASVRYCRKPQINPFARFDGHPRTGVVQRELVMGITVEDSCASAERLDELHTYFCKLFPNFFTRIEKIRDAQSKSRIADALKPIQQKSLRVPISHRDKVDKEIDRLFKEGHVIKLQDCLDKNFVSPILITAKKDGSIKLALESRTEQTST